MGILDILGIAAVFAIVLYIGWSATKKTQSADDFLMANRSLGKIQAGFSMAATDMGGNAVVGAVAYAYAVGIGGAWYNWGAVIPMFLLGVVLAKKLRTLPISSIPELLGKRYHTSARLISVIAQLLAIGATLGIQFTISASVISTISGINYELALIASVVVVVLYTVGGGLLAVVNTDVFQFIVIVLSVVLVIPFALHAAGGYTELMGRIPEGYMDFGSQGVLAPLSLGLLYMFDYATNQHILQRIFAAKDSSTAKFAYKFSGVTYLIFGLLVAFIGVLAYGIFPDLDNADMAYAALIKDVLPSGIAGIALGGIFAATMSTADSKIMASSQLFVNDIIELYVLKGKKLEDQQVLKISRIVTIAICVFGIGISLISDSIVQLMYVGGLFYGTAVFVPMIFALFWKRGTAAGALCAILASIGVGLFSEYYLSSHAQGILAMPSNLMAALTGLIVFVAVSLLTPPPAKEKLEVLKENARES